MAMEECTSSLMPVIMVSIRTLTSADLATNVPYPFPVYLDNPKAMNDLLVKELDRAADPSRTSFSP